MDVKLLLLIFAAVLGIIISALVSRQTPSQAVSKKPRQLISIPTSLQPEEVFAVIQEYAPRADLQVAEVNRAEGKVILRQDAQVLHNGFWLPIYITIHKSGITVVEVGMLPLTPLGYMPHHILSKTAKQLETLMQPVHL